jgi:hypothetical protein
MIERDPAARIVLSWLREDAHENAERVLLLALDEVDATQQRRSRWPAWRTLDMPSVYKLALAAAAVLVVAIVGYNLLPRSNTVGPPGPSQTVAPTANLTPTPAPTTVPVASGEAVLPEGPLPAGTYSAYPFPVPDDGLRMLFTVPDGWSGAPPNAVTPVVGTAGPDGAAVAALLPYALYLDPCTSKSTFNGTRSTGDSVDDLVDALVEIASGPDAPYQASTPEATEISGFAGKRLDLLLPSDVDFATCHEGLFWVWEPGPYAQGVGNRWHLSILDVDGTRVVILAEDFATTPAVTQAQMQAIVDSLQIIP